VLVGIVNLVFTIAAMTLIDRVGRRPLLGAGIIGIAVCMLTLSYGFGSATYTLSQESINALPAAIDREQVAPLAGTSHFSDIEFRDAVTSAIGREAFQQYESQLVNAAIDINPNLILFGILGFVASFAISLGPIMWVLFSELFPNSLRGLAISFVGLINSGISFGVQLIFPWELEVIGNAGTFLIYGLVAIVGLFFVMRLLPETKGKSLEQLEELLVRN
jgi:SP family arabinose:H+ symporter-like MFS transporter